MPLFDWRCDKCGHEFEMLIQSWKSPNPLCIECGAVETSKIFKETPTLSGGENSEFAFGVKDAYDLLDSPKYRRQYAEKITVGPATQRRKRNDDK